MSVDRIRRVMEGFPSLEEQFEELVSKIFGSHTASRCTCQPE